MNVASIMTPDPLTVPRGATLDRAMDLMDEHDIRHLPVLDREGLAGVVSDRDVLEATGWLSPRQREVIEAPGGVVDDVMRSPAAAVSPDDPISRALGLIVQRRIGCVTVVRDGSLEGIVTEVDILRAYADACRRGAIEPSADETVAEHMSRDPATIDGESSGDEAAALMQSAHVRHLPVLQGATVAGMLSDRDVRRARGRGQLELTLVRELVGPVPRSPSPDQRLSSLAAILSAERIGALPVVSGGRLVGIATTVDVVIPCALALERL